MRGLTTLNILIVILVVLLLYVFLRSELMTGIYYVKSSMIDQEKVSEMNNANKIDKWSNLSVEKFLSGFNRPLYLTHSNDGSEDIFVVEKGGVIRVVDQASKSVQVFLNITDRVRSKGGEQGLLSVAFHPDYEDNQRFFVYYTDNSGDVVVSEFGADKKNGIADENTEKVIIKIDEPYSNHNGGQLMFGGDGYLYIGTGDGGSAADPHDNAQNLNVLLGKILRIDVDNGDKYSIPADNPFTNSDNARGEIWAYGLRNPWRFSFDPENYDLYIGDVGQNQWEEVNYQPGDSSGGENYGWDYLEGLNSFEMDEEVDISELAMPVAEYSHDHGCSVTGGYVYRGEQFEEIKGTYFFGDYCTGIIWGLRRNSEKKWEYARFLDSKLAISSFGIDSDNEIYVIDYRKGDIYKLVAEE